MSPEQQKQLEEENLILKARCGCQMVNLVMDQREIKAYQEALEKISGEKNMTAYEAQRLAKEALEKWRVRNGL
jgi:hypothetical protein